MADQGGWNDTHNYTPGGWDQNGWEDPYAGQTGDNWGQQQTIMPTGNVATAGGNWTYDQFGNLIPVQQLSLVDQLRKKHGTYGKRNSNAPNTKKAVWEQPEDEVFLDTTDKAVLTEQVKTTTTTRKSTSANYGAHYLERRKDELVKRVNKIEKVEDQIRAQRALNESILAKMQEQSHSSPKNGSPSKSILKCNTAINVRRTSNVSRPSGGRRVSFGGDQRRRMRSASSSKGSSKGRSSSNSRGPSKGSGWGRSQASQSSRGRSQASRSSQGRPSKGAGRNGASKASQGRPSKVAGRNGASQGSQGRPSNGAGRNGASQGSQGRPSNGAGRNGASQGSQGRPSQGAGRLSQGRRLAASPKQIGRGGR